MDGPHLVLAIQGPLRFRVNLRAFSISAKIVIRVLRGIALSLQITLSGIDILTVLSLPIREHGMCFHLFVVFHFFKQYCLVFIVQVSHLLS